MNELNDFNTTIDTWIGFLDHYSFDQLTQKPNPGSWSLGQVYMHILADTPYHVGQMKEALHTEADSEKEMHPNARWMFDNNMFPDIRIEGASTDDNTPQPVSKADILRQLHAIRKEVNDICRAADLAGAKGKTRHPGLLFFSAREWLRFTEMHMRHHLRQKARIDQTVRFRSL